MGFDSPVRVNANEDGFCEHGRLRRTSHGWVVGILRFEIKTLRTTIHTLKKVSVDFDVDCCLFEGQKSRQPT